MKICNKCGVEKELEEFNTSRNDCKECRKKYREENKEKLRLKAKEYREKNKEDLKSAGKNYYLNNKEKINKINKKYYQENKDFFKEYRKEYYKENKKELKIVGKNYYIKNKEKLKDNHKSYYLNNKEKILKKNKEYHNKNKNNDDYLLKRREVNKNWCVNNKEKRKVYSQKHFQLNKEKIYKRRSDRGYSKNYYKNNKEKIRKSYNISYNKHPYRYTWRALLKRTLSYFDNNKKGKTIEILGYSAEMLKEHITSQFTTGMTWENYGEWHIDHIKSISLFNRKTPPSIVNELSNLKPMWSTTREINGVIYEGNLNKGNKIE